MKSTSSGRHNGTGCSPTTHDFLVACNCTPLASATNGTGSHPAAGSLDALLYIVVVLLFYAFSIVVMMVKYIRRENKEAYLRQYFDEFVAREPFQTAQARNQECLRSLLGRRGSHLRLAKPRHRGPALPGPLLRLNEEGSSLEECNSGIPGGPFASSGQKASLTEQLKRTSATEQLSRTCAEKSESAGERDGIDDLRLLARQSHAANASEIGNSNDPLLNRRFQFSPSSRHSLQDFLGKERPRFLESNIVFHQPALDQDQNDVVSRCCSLSAIDVSQFYHNLILPEDPENDAVDSSRRCQSADFTVCRNSITSQTCRPTPLELSEQIHQDVKYNVNVTRDYKATHSGGVRNQRSDTMAGPQIDPMPQIDIKVEV